MVPSPYINPPRQSSFKGAVLAGVVLAGLTSAQAHAQSSTLPSLGSITLVVPTAAQGSTDQLARLLAEGLKRRGLGEVTVKNVPGRSGTMAAAQVAAAIPDGRTLLVATSSSHGIAPAVETRLPYDPVRSFTPIVRFATAPYLLVVKPEGPATLAQFELQARAARPPWRYSSTGQGGPHHLVAAYYFQRAGMALNHVPMAGGAEALDRVRTGSVEVMLPAAILALPAVKIGQLKALAVTGRQRLNSLPEVPTFAEAGVPLEIESWYGLMAPAGLPATLALRLADAVEATLSEAPVQAQLGEMATLAANDRADEFARLITQEVKQWTALVGELKIRPEGP